MTTYKNLSGNSGVTAYKIHEEGIYVQFQKEVIYYYSYSAPGKDHVENMKKLAENGKGLATYISQNIRSNFDHKE